MRAYHAARQGSRQKIDTIKVTSAYLLRVCLLERMGVEIHSTQGKFIIIRLWVCSFGILFQTLWFLKQIIIE